MMTRRRTRIVEQGCHQMLQMYEEECEIGNQTVDHECLKKYDQHNEHFSMKVSITEIEEEERVSYRCKYRYRSHEVKLEYDLSSEKWKLASDKYHSGEKQLKTLVERVNKFSLANRSLILDKQIQYVLETLDAYFLELDTAEEEAKTKKKILKPSLTIEKQHVIECVETESFKPRPSNDDKQQSSKDTIFSSSSLSEEEGDFAFLEEDLFDHDLYSSKPSTHQKSNDIEAPLVAPRRSRQNSVQYASLNPSPTAPVRWRHVIESILLHVHRKKKMFEKLVDVVKRRETPTIYELGLEFLRIYDGKFNYREGHTFVMSYRKKIWFLTIDQIKCVDCPVDEIGPRSTLILNYKGQYSRVHV